MTERSFEASEDDVAEQQTVEQEDEPAGTDGSDEMDPADRAEQERVVEADDDEYR
jgi:hypothetical protein